MRSVKIKLASSVLIAVLIVASVPLVGLTESSVDTKEGLVLDFGYWDTQWVEMQFTEGMNGDDVLDTACEALGYEVIRLNDGSVYSIDGQENLIGTQWGFYVQSDGNWVRAVASETYVSEYSLITWARSSGVDSLIPGSDYSGYTYYSYAKDGKSPATGEDLRIVTLAPSVTETVASVKGAQYIIGTDLYSDYPEEIAEGHNDGTIAITGGYVDPNYEWIIKLDPDIVFCDGSVGQQVTVADKLRKSGINCVILYDTVDIGAIYDNIWIVASALGLSENANSVIYDLRTTINIVSGIAGETNKRVFAALSADPSPWTAGSYTFMSDLISAAGGINVFESQSSSWFMVSKEQIYAKQPQAIIIIVDNEVTCQEDYQAILDSLDPMWKSTPAYENGNVYVFSGDAADILSRPGPRLAQAAELLCKILNPDVFMEYDPLDAIPMYLGDDYYQYLSYQKEVFSST